MAVTKGLNFKVSASVAGQAAITSFTRAISGIASVGTLAKNSMLGFSSEMNKQQRSYDALSALSKSYGVVLSELNRAQQLNSISGDEWVATMNELQTAYRDAKVQFAESPAAAESFLNKFRIELEQLTAKFNPAAAASQRYDASVMELNRALALGVINQNQYSQELQKLPGSLAGVIVENERLRLSMKSVADSASVFALEISDLEARINPISPEINRLRDAMTDLARAEQLGMITNEQYQQRLYQLQSAFRATTVAAAAPMRKFNIASESWNRGLSANRRALQNIGFQVGDFAVQIGGGQSALLAFVQQGSQVLQFFGVWGAVTAGLLSVFGTLLIVMVKTGGALNNLAPVAGQLATVFSGLYTAVSGVGRAILPVINAILGEFDTIVIAGGIVATFMAGRWVISWFMATTSVRAFLFSLALVGPVQTAVIVGTTLLTGAMTLLTIAMNLVPLVAMVTAAAFLIKWFLQLARGAGGFGAALGLLADVGSEVFGRIGVAMELASQEARIVASNIGVYFLGAFNNLMHYANVAAHSVAETLATIDDVLNGPGKGRAIVPSVAEVELKMGTFIDVSNLVSDVAEAERRVFSLSEDLIAPLQSVNALMDAFRKGDTGGVDVTDWFSGVAGVGEGAGAALADVAKEYANLVRSIDPAIRATKQFRDLNDEMMSAFQTGNLAMIQETFDRIKPLMEQLASDFKSVADSLSSTFLTAFKGIVTGTKSVRDGVMEMLNAVIDRTLDLLMAPVFDGIAGFITKGIFGLSGAMPPLPSMEGGGYTGGKSRSGGLDGKGGFLAVMHPQESVTDHTMARGSNRGGPASVTVNVYVDGATGNSEVMQMVNRGVSAGLEYYDRRVLPQSIKRVSANPRRNG